MLRSGSVTERLWAQLWTKYLWFLQPVVPQGWNDPTLAGVRARISGAPVTGPMGMLSLSSEHSWMF